MLKCRDCKYARWSMIDKNYDSCSHDKSMSLFAVHTRLFDECGTTGKFFEKRKFLPKIIWPDFFSKYKIVVSFFILMVVVLFTLLI